MTGTFEEFATLARAGHRRVPVMREVGLEADSAVEAFVRLHRGRFGFLLESVEGGERWARYTFLGTEPCEVLRYRGRRAEAWTPDGWRTVADDVAPLAHLRERLGRPAAPAPSPPPFGGGAVGWLGYDLVRTLERHPAGPPDTTGLPDAVLMLCDMVLVIDNRDERAFVVATPELPVGAGEAALRAAWDGAAARIGKWAARLRQGEPLEAMVPGMAPPPVPGSPYPAPRFEADVRRIQECIGAGDAFQVVLSRRLELPAPDPFLTYRHLREINPAPYLYYLDCDGVQVAGASPEVLVRVGGGTVTVRPIAGTRRRGSCREEDVTLEVELLADPKERAEHLMLVDLGRNDVGRVAEYGSVEVTDLMAVERYSHVMHLVSEVRGRLRPGLDALDALAAAFPAGTVTGAPKVRAMEIIAELEPERRGPYGGAVGYVGWGADSLDTAITIRTAVFHGGRVSVQAGAGIVADSVPAAEFRETEAKAGAVLAALERAAGSEAGRPARAAP
jgi:anthranilate synthase component 1